MVKNHYTVINHMFYQKRFKTIDDCIKEFHSSISVGPLYVCTCCHQTWFRKSVSMLKNTHIPIQIRRLYCTKFTSVNDEEWVCNTCLNTLKDTKMPKLSVANEMKWPNKPPNIFFKHKKLQMKQLNDKVNLAVRRCKNEGKKITEAEARDSTYLDKLVKLDEGYYIFRQLRNSPAYLEARKNTFFQ